MADTIANGFWLTIIDMTVVFLVLYVIALTIRAIKIVVGPLGNGPGGGRADTRAIPQPESVESAPDVAPVSDAGGTEGLDAETTAVIAAALAAYLEKPAFVPVLVEGESRRGESLWAMAGRTRVMQARDLVKRRATA